MTLLSVRFSTLTRAEHFQKTNATSQNTETQNNSDARPWTKLVFDQHLTATSVKMAILISLLNNFGFHICLVFLIFAISYFYLRKKREPKLVILEEKSQESEEKLSDLDSESEEEIAPALPDDLEHIEFKSEKYSEEEMIQRSEEFFESMNKRRSLRFFSDQKIPAKVIENIIATAGTSPSGAHTEPWTYVVVNSFCL